VRRKKFHGLTLVYASKGLLEESCKRIGVNISYNIPREQLPYPSPEEWKQVFKDKSLYSNRLFYNFWREGAQTIKADITELYY